MKKLKLLTIGLLILIIGVLAYFNISPRAYKEDFIGLKSPISEAKDVTGLDVFPRKLDGLSKEALVMEKDRLYFNVFLNDVFVNASFKIKFRNEKQPEFNLRVPVHQGVEDAVKYYLEEKELDKLKGQSGWFSVQDEDALLLQKVETKDRIFPSVNAFFQDLPKDNAKPIAYAGDFTFPSDIDTRETNLIPLEKVLEAEKFYYLVSRYKPWKEEEGWKTNEYEVSIPEAFRRKNVSFPFYLEAPNLENEKNIIIIDSVEIILKKPSALYADMLYNGKIVKIK